MGGRHDDLRCGDLRWGPLGPDDRTAVEGLLTAAERFDRTGPRILHGWRHQLAPISDEQSHTLAAWTRGAAGGELVALGWVSTRPFDNVPRRVFLAGAVHPAHRRRGLGRQLLTWQIEVARRWQRELGGDPITIVASSAPLPDVRRLLTAAGFTPARVFAELRLPLPRSDAQRCVSLSKGPSPACPEPVEGSKDRSREIAIAPYSADRAEDVRIVLNASFADHWGARVLPPVPWQALLSSPTFRPEWCWLALADDRVVGFVLNSAASHPEHATVGWTDQLGVLPEYRHHGVGSALMEVSLATFERAGLALAGLGLDTENPFGAPALYDHLGYRPGFEVHLFTRSEPALE